jgi:hypothetical protein
MIFAGRIETTLLQEILCYSSVSIQASTITQPYSTNVFLEFYDNRRHGVEHHPGE